MKKPQKKFIRHIFGIKLSKDVKLSNISRSLKEDIPLIKTENRLSCNLSQNDIRKEYAKRMDNLTTVYNGSCGCLNATGYWLLSVLGADVKGDELMPLI